MGMVSAIALNPTNLSPLRGLGLVCASRPTKFSPLAWLAWEMIFHRSTILSPRRDYRSPLGLQGLVGRGIVGRCVARR